MKSATTRVHHESFTRLNRIHKEISAGRYPTLQKLCEVIERSARTVKRDLRALRDDWNAPLEFDRARRGYYYKAPGWEFPLKRMTEGELFAFFAAERALKAIGRSPEAALLRSGLAKLAAQLPEEVLFNLAELTDRMSFQAAPQVAVDATTLQKLARAAVERRTVEFDYYTQSRDDQNRRTVHVLLLHDFAGDWYAIGWDEWRKDYRDFHVGRISNLRLTKRFFEPPAGWDKDDYLRRGFQMTRGGRLTTVSLVFDEYQARWIRERDRFHPDEKRDDLPDGGLRLKFPVGQNGLEAVARFCLTYAGHCRVEAPAALRRLVIERLRQALAQQQSERC
jgi:predicted DNA-binding transcriptional regulator YafY